MAELFSAEWMNQLKDAWNAEPEVRDKLAEIGFSS
ncbi:MAG: SCP-2 sterol transfer family protein, partial [Sedimenticolaceae bacterium]